MGARFASATSLGVAKREPEGGDVEGRLMAAETFCAAAKDEHATGAGVPSVLG